MPSPCEQVRQEYQELQTLKEEFDLERQKAASETKPSLERAKKLKAELDRKRDLLREKLWPFEHLSQKELQKQYQFQKETLQRVGILEELSSGEAGIKAIDGQEYAFPEFREITRRMRENREILKIKTEQEFSQLLVVPFGLKLDDLIERYRQVILKHHKEGKLLATKENLSDPDERLELDTSDPVWVWEEYQDADTSGGLVYFPKEFSSHHQGRTKQEILKEQGGFNILFIEDLPNIPRKNKGKKVSNRKQLEANQTPKRYLELLTDPQYRNESGMTPEEQIIYAIQYLEETNQVIDDYQGKGSASYQLGAYFPASGFVPCAYWRRDRRQAGLGGNEPGGSNPVTGARAAVRVPA